MQLSFAYIITFAVLILAFLVVHSAKDHES